MRAELKSFDFYGSIIDMEQANKLTQEKEYLITICLSIGMKGQDGADYFYLDVYNTEWIRKRLEYKWGRSTLIIDADNIYEIKDVIENKVNSIEGEDWDAIVNKLVRYFSWEYDDVKQINL